MDRWVPSQRRTTKPASPRAGFSEAGFSRAGFGFWKFPLAGEQDSPTGVGERDFRPFSSAGSLGSGIFLSRVLGSGVFPHRLRSPKTGICDRVPRQGRWEWNFPPPGSREAGFSLWERDSLFRNSPSRDFPRQGHRGAGFSTGPPAPFTEERDLRPGAPPGSLGSGIFPGRGRGAAGFALQKFPLAGSGIPPPGSPGSGIFDRVPRQVCWGAEFSPARVVGSGVFPRRGQVQGVKGHSILHCTPWLAGILRSVDSICWQGADLEAVAFSCTGRRLARAANGLGFRVLL